MSPAVENLAWCASGGSYKKAGDARPGFPAGRAITGQFQLIIDHQHVRRLQMALQTLAVQESQGIKGGQGSSELPPP
jgi:hypothetical protein